MGVKRDLGNGPVGIDTSLFIYFVEMHPDWRPVVRPIFQLASAGEMQLVTSELTLAEVLVTPLRAGNLAVAARYEVILARGRGLTLLPVNRNVLRSVAHLRARYALRTPDAIQIASALQERCTSFITNDRRIPEIPGLAVIQLRDLA